MRKLSAYVDRIEEGCAVLLLEDAGQQLKLPQCLLPDDVGEGDYMAITLAYDQQANEEAEREAEALRHGAETEQ